MPHQALPAFFVPILLATAAVGQCNNPWLPGPSLPGPNGAVQALIRWDPDGGGPQAARAVAAGRFTTAGGVVVNGIATLDPATGTWQALGSGMNGDVQALAVLPSGDLIAAGAFTTADGQPRNRIARWGGTSWVALGSGLSDTVRALAVRPNGELFASGFFTSAGGLPAAFIARWNGLQWSPLGSGLDSDARCLTLLNNGDLVAGGSFTTAGGAAANGLARWNGATWSSFNFGVGSDVDCVFTLPGGDLLASGALRPPGQGLATNARWNGTTWTVVPFGGKAMAVLPNGDLAFAVGNGVSIWNGAQFVSLGSGNDTTNALLSWPTGELFTGGWFQQINGVDAPFLVRWNGQWLPLQTPVDRLLSAAGVVSRSGQAIAGGTFRTAAGASVQRVARLDGSTWTNLGEANGPILALIRLANGDIVAGGTFTQIGGNPASRIARWDGISWQQLGQGLTSEVFALAVTDDGDLIAGGQLTQAGSTSIEGIARWNGVTWSAIGTGLSGIVQRLAVLPNGNLVAVGQFGAPTPGVVARWNGTNWQALGNSVWDAVPRAVVGLSNNDIVVGGAFTIAGGNGANRLARWNGASWTTFAGGISGDIAAAVEAMLRLPNGDLLTVGRFTATGGVPCNNIARWNGTTWAPLGAGLDRAAFRLSELDNTGVVVAGDFNRADTVATDRLARLTTNCLAAIATSGNGCVGSGGVGVLASSSLPWTGSLFRSRATGMPFGGVALTVVGFSTVSVPLSLLLPPSGNSCALLVAPDIVGTASVVGGSVQLALAIPNTQSLAGGIVHQQAIGLQLGTSGITGSSATNRLSLTIGSF